MLDQVPSKLSAAGAKRGVRFLQLPDWSPPNDPTKARRPKAGQGLVMEIIVIIVVVVITFIVIVTIIIIIITRPWPAFGRQGLVGSSGGYTYHGYTSYASPRACGARLGRKVSRNGRNVISPIYRHD